VFTVKSLIETACQHLLLLVGIDTLIYRKYYDTPPILVGYQDYFLVPLPGSEALLESGIGKGSFTVSAVFALLFYYGILYSRLEVCLEVYLLPLKR